MPVEAIDKGFVRSGGKRYAIGLVQPVLAGTASKNIPAALAKGSERRDAERRRNMQEFVPALRAFLRTGGKHPTAVGRHMADKWEFSEKLKENKLTVTSFAKLYDEFEVTGKLISLRAGRTRVRVTGAG